MALPALLTRLNCPGYKNWVRAGQCLLVLQNRLQGYIDREMRDFHRQLAGPRPERRCQCRPRLKQFQPGCPACAQWKELILAHHNNRHGEIYWGNSDPSLWPAHYWEVAKVYMPRGQAQCKGSKHCDAAALLNLMSTCDHFGVSNISRVKEMLKCRNELMHSSDMTVSSTWLEAFGQKIHDLITELAHVPGLVEEGEKIQEVLLSDWNVEDSGTYEIDGPEEVQSQRVPVISQGFAPCDVEIQLIQQLFQELYLEIEDQSSLTKENEDKVSKMKEFLSKNEDLKLVFQGELERLESLWKNPVLFNEEG